MENITTIIVTFLTVMGSAAMWKFFEAKLKTNAEFKKAKLLDDDGTQYRDDLKHRVKNLESLLCHSSQEKDDLREQVLLLVAEVNALRVKVEYLEKENQRLKNT